MDPKSVSESAERQEFDCGNKLSKISSIKIVCSTALSSVKSGVRFFLSRGRGFVYSFGQLASVNGEFFKQNICGQFLD